MMTETTKPAATPPQPKRRIGVGLLLGACLLSAAIAGGGVALLLRRDASHDHSDVAAAQQSKPQYQCPMHPTIVQDHPGDCPICGMKLVKVESKTNDPSNAVEGGQGAPKSSPSPARQRKVVFYRSPMDPKQTSPTPRKDEMGMDYLPVYEDELSGAATSVEGMATVNVDAARQQLIGLSTAEVTKGSVGGSWRTVGRVAIDETRVKHINVKIPGFVERINVDFVGKPVRKGDPLFSIYSPELLAAQQEYLLALKTRGALTKVGGIAADGDSLVAAARRKLALWDVPESEIERIQKTGEPVKTLAFYSPISGVVTKKDVVEGMKLDAGAMPYEIVDLSTVWVLADVYESELRYVKVGMAASLTLNAFPGREFKGQVAFIDPLLNPQTRTIKVRLSFPNPTGDLRPEMFGETVLHSRPRDGLRIPADSVIDSGTEKIVFLALGDGKFAPRKVRLGDSDGTNVEVVEGLAAGERVVTRANFLIDSESRLRASLAQLTGAAPVKAPESARVLPEGTATQHASNDATAGHGTHQP